MTATTYRIDPPASRLRIWTRAEGALSRFAHDLEIATSSLRGEVVVDDDFWAADIVVPVVSLRVAGTLKGEAVQPDGLSAGDRAEVEHKIREQVLAGTSDVRVRAEGSNRELAELTISVAAGSCRIRAPLRTLRSDPALTVKGRVDLSLRSLGVREVKGPLGVFRMKDRVEVLYDITLRPS
jgi:hypothetical protein